MVYTNILQAGIFVVKPGSAQLAVTSFRSFETCNRVYIVNIRHYIYSN